MWTVIFCTFAGVALVIVSNFDAYDTAGRRIAKFIAGGIFGILPGLMIGIVLASIIGILFDKKIQARDVRLVPISEISSASGITRFLFLEKRLVEGKWYYLYRVDAGREYPILKAPIERVYGVYEENQPNGRLVVLETVFKREWVEKFAINYSRNKYELHIPKGSFAEIPSAPL